MDTAQDPGNLMAKQKIVLLVVLAIVLFGIGQYLVIAFGLRYYFYSYRGFYLNVLGIEDVLSTVAVVLGLGAFILWETNRSRKSTVSPGNEILRKP